MPQPVFGAARFTGRKHFMHGVFDDLQIIGMHTPHGAFPILFHQFIFVHADQLAEPAIKIDGNDPVLADHLHADKTAGRVVHQPYQRFIVVFNFCVQIPAAEHGGNIIPDGLQMTDVGLQPARIIDAQKTDQLTVAAKGYRNQRVNALLAQNTPLLGTMLIQLCHVLDTDKTVLFKRVEPKRACFQRDLLQKILLAADALGTRFIRII